MTMTITVRGMTCQGCEAVVEKAVELLDGVEAASADRYENVVHIDGNVDVDGVAEKVELAGYRAGGPVDATDGQASPSPAEAAGDPDAESVTEEEALEEE